MSYATIAATKQFTGNVVIKMGADYFADHTPDSGLTPAANKVGIVRRVRLAGSKVSVRDASTVVGTATLELLDVDGALTAYVGAAGSTLYSQDVEVWHGFVGASMPWSDYRLYSRLRVKRAKFNGQVWSFECVTIMDQAKVDVFTWLAVVAMFSLTDVATSVTVDDTTDFPSSGMLKIDDEFMTYSGKTATTFTGLSRGALGSTAAAHDIGAEIRFFKTLTGNPVTLVLQLLASTGAGTNGVYDVLESGCGIDEDYLDVDAFVDAAALFSGTYTLYLSNTDALDFITAQLLMPSGTRLLVRDGQISLVAPDRAEFLGIAGDLPQRHIKGVPSWDQDANEIVNVVVARWNQDPVSGNYATVERFISQDSITAYGERPSREFEFAGTMTSDTELQAVMRRLVTRSAFPKGAVTATAQLVAGEAQPGETVRLTHALVPQPGGGLGCDSDFEVVGRSNDLYVPSVELDLEFTSYTGYALGFIAPSPLIATVTSQTVFSVPTDYGAFYRAGYKLRLWNDVTSAYYSDPVNTIQSVSGDTITMASPFSTTLTTAVRVTLSDYDDASAEQKRYAFVGPAAGAAFPDGQDPYQIIP